MPMKMSRDDVLYATLEFGRNRIDFEQPSRVRQSVDKQPGGGGPMLAHEARANGVEFGLQPLGHLDMPREIEPGTDDMLRGQSG